MSEGPSFRHPTENHEMTTLHDCATAPSPRRARILPAERGLAHATVNVDLGKDCDRWLGGMQKTYTLQMGVNIHLPGSAIA